MGIVLVSEHCEERRFTMGNKANLIFLWATLVAVVAMATEHRPFERTKGINGLEKIIVRDRRGRSFEVYLYGVPRFWEIDAHPPPLPSHPSSSAHVDLILKSSEADSKIWPNKFVYRLRVALGHGGDLILTSRVKNSDVKPFNFTVGLHPYFSVSDISKIQVEGLQNLDYLDQQKNRTRFTDHGKFITFSSQLDRLYLRTPKKIRIVDHNKKKTIVVHKEGYADAVVWNPWEKKVSDLGVEDYKRFVAVEPVAVEKPIKLKPGQEWKGVLQVSVVPSGNLGYLIFLWATLVAVVSMATAQRPFERTKGINGLEKIIVYLYGGQVASWKNEKGEELLVMSSKYANTGPLPSHGFVRQRFWEIDTNPPQLPSNSYYKAWVDLILRSSQDDLKIWPHKLRVHLGTEGDLILTSRVKNTDVKPFNFTMALHPYFSVSDISEIQVDGLQNLNYLDQLKNRTRFTDHDKIYLSTPDDIRIVDKKKQKTIVVHKEGQVDAVVWNPWEKKVEDLGTEDYRRFVTVESAAVEKPITVNPGQEWKGILQMSVNPVQNNKSKCFKKFNGTQYILHYKGSIIHSVTPGKMWYGGDITHGNGYGGESIYAGYQVTDKKFIQKHDRKGISMVNFHENVVGSQLMLLMKEFPDLDGDQVAFGQVLDGFQNCI
ncbi:hypothetical protein HID58_001548 [Brassica napus]|uniref:PPIase cyclophilin-type domain-containing protein n=4 Tax=Brassica TaxID=3705 RepID=A0ABQ8EJS5_BRANA|nr:hypothetical protein HID58_001548 [Brassica napus]